MGPMQAENISGKRYVFVCVDDFSKFTWIDFLKEKSKTFDIFKKLCKRLTNFLIEKGYERGGVDKTLFIKKDKCDIVIAKGSCCTQLLWMKQMLADYGIVQDILVLL